LDWRLIDTFLRVARAGSVSTAAKALAVSQPTVSRQIQALEEHLAVQLFVRHARGLTLTNKGAELVEAAEQLDEGVQTFWRRATGMRAELEGSVRVSAAEPIAIYVLGPALRRLRSIHPQIRVELVVDNSLANLSRREADIAVRMVRPTQPDLVAKKLGEIAMGLFASPAYLDRHGPPQGLADMAKHTLIGFDRDPGWHEAIRRLGLRPEDFAVRTDAIAAQLSFACQDVGIAALHRQLASRFQLLPVLEGNIPLPPLEVWLVVHQDQRNTPALRAVSAELERALRTYIDD
jgi:DNA-binding transcriptional LysR family regulator